MVSAHHITSLALFGGCGLSQFFYSDWSGMAVQPSSPDLSEATLDYAEVAVALNGALRDSQVLDRR